MQKKLHASERGGGCRGTIFTHISTAVFLPQIASFNRVATCCSSSWLKRSTAQIPNLFLPNSHFDTKMIKKYWIYPLESSSERLCKYFMRNKTHSAQYFLVRNTECEEISTLTRWCHLNQQEKWFLSVYDISLINFNKHKMISVVSNCSQRIQHLNEQILKNLKSDSCGWNSVQRFSTRPGASFWLSGWCCPT